MKNNKELNSKRQNILFLAIGILLMISLTGCGNSYSYNFTGGSFGISDPDRERLFPELSSEEKDHKIDSLSTAVLEAAKKGEFVALDEEFLNEHHVEGWSAADLEKFQVTTRYKKIDDENGIKVGNLPPFVLIEYQILPDEEFMREASEDEGMEMMGAILDKSVEFVQKGDETLDAEKLAKEVEGLSQEEAGHLSITPLYTRETPQIKEAIAKGHI